MAASQAAQTPRPAGAAHAERRTENLVKGTSRCRLNTGTREEQFSSEQAVTTQLNKFGATDVGCHAHVFVGMRVALGRRACRGSCPMATKTWPCHPERRIEATQSGGMLSAVKSNV